MLCKFSHALALGILLLSSLPSHSHPLPDFTELVKQVRSAVVNISTTQKPNQEKPAPSPHGLPEGSPLEEFLKRFMPEGETPFDFERESLGSGFILSDDGYVLTNHHVVRDADEIIVRLSDRREFRAQVVGTDPRSDLALIRIDAKNLPTVKLGRSEDLQVGEWVVAIGSPFGFEHSVTVGVVSAKGRSLPNESYVPFIQTDVAINPGNSGGPLFNLKGEVVGINSQIFSRTGGYMGLSFAIPIDVGMSVADQLKSRGKVARGWMGVYIQDVTQELAQSFKMNSPRGALVTRIVPDSPAAQAGFEVGDVIIEFDDHAVDNSSMLPPLVGRSKIGEQVPVKVIREGKTKVLSMRVGELPEDIDALASEPIVEQGSEIARLNIRVIAPDSDQRKQLKLDDHGVLVSEVQPGAGRRAGLREGDIILRVQGQQITSINQLQKLIKTLPAAKPIPFLIQRDGGAQFIAVTLDT